jgi:MinD-like ATPase involved in chromosome partitioning or flagellar assembly
MISRSIATGITFLAGSGGSGRTTAATGLAARLANMNRTVLLVDLCFGWTGLKAVSAEIPTYESLLKFEGDLRDLTLSTDYGFDLLTTVPPGVLNPDESELKSIAWLIHDLSRHYDFLILDPPSGAQPLGMLAAALCDRIFLLVRSEAAAVASSYCLLKTLVGEGLSDRVKVIFGFVNSAEHAASLKTKFDLLTGQFLSLKFEDGGFIYSRTGYESEDFCIEPDGDELATLVKNIKFDETDLFQNETTSETIREAYQKPF